MSVVVGYSPSPQGDAALDAAAAEARRRGTALVVAAHEYTDPDRGRRCATEPEVRDACSPMRRSSVPSQSKARGAC